MASSRANANANGETETYRVYRSRLQLRIEGRLGGDGDGNWTGCGALGLVLAAVLVLVLEFVTRVSVGVSAQTRWRIGRHAAFELELERLSCMAGVHVVSARRGSSRGIIVDGGGGLQFEVGVEMEVGDMLGSDWRLAGVIGVHARWWEMSGGRLGDLMNTVNTR